MPKQNFRIALLILTLLSLLTCSYQLVGEEQHTVSPFLAFNYNGVVRKYLLHLPQ